MPPLNCVKSVLFVCYANICRSPTAHAVFKHKANNVELGLHIDSAGTNASNKGHKPDYRAVKLAEEKGYNFTDIVSRRISDDDFLKYDLILAMDSKNFNQLLEQCPVEHLHKIKYFLDYAMDFPDLQEVPDPYYASSKAFEFVLTLIENASNGLVKQLSLGH